jgi:hypothetical protein
MKVIVNKIIPFKGFAAINLFGVLFVREGVTITYRLIQHETIHTHQMKVYVAYVLEWLVKLLFYGKNAYRNISFEREAYANEEKVGYLDNRPFCAFLKYIF